MALFHLSFGKSSVKQLKRIGYGVFKDKSQARTEYTEEAVILIWPEKWEGLKLHASGHAAMKLKRFEPAENAVKLADYVSWWPEGGAQKRTPLQKGQAKSTYGEDEQSEILLPIHVTLFLGFLWEALAEGPEDRAKVFAEVWKQSAELDKTNKCGLIARYKQLGFTENFSNFEKRKGRVKERGDQKRLKGSDKDFNEDWRGDLFGGMGPDQVARTVLGGDGRFGKRPLAKIYLPCSTLPALDGGNAQVWGLSFDAMRCSWQAFSSDSHPKYEMQSHEINCVGVVWQRLIAGHGDLFTSFTKTFSLPKLIRSKVSYVPSDLIPVGEALDKIFAKMNAQQKVLDELAVAKTNRLAVITKFVELNSWREILNVATWKKLSEAQGAGSRSVELAALDKVIAKYESARQAMSHKEERRLIEAILDDFHKLQKLQHGEESLDDKITRLEVKNELDTKKYRKKAEQAQTAEKIDKYLSILAELAAAQEIKGTKKTKSLRRDQQEMTLALIQTNLGFLAEQRRKMIPHLITIHNEVYKFARTHKKSPRLPAVLLLGQCVAYAYWEAAHFGKHITTCEVSSDENELLLPFANTYLSDATAILKPTEETTKSVKQTVKKLAQEKDLEEMKSAFAQLQRLNVDSLLQSQAAKRKEKLKKGKKVEWCEEHDFPLNECPYC